MAACYLNVFQFPPYSAVRQIMSKACTKYLLVVEKFPLKFVWNGEQLVWSLFWHHDFPDLRSEWLWGYKILILSTSQFTWFYSIDEIGNHSFCSKHSLLKSEPFYLDIFCNSIHIVSDLFRSNFSIRFQIWSLAAENLHKNWRQ